MVMLRAALGNPSALSIVVVELPQAPKVLSANSKAADRVGANQKSAYRANCKDLIALALRQHRPNLPLAVRIRYGTASHPVLGKSDGIYRPRDAGNVSVAAKRIHDALQDATGINDSKFILAGDYIDKTYRGVQLLIAWPTVERINEPKVD
jgi:Holliday junction resolvase RusA-like endonuclease